MSYSIINIYSGETIEESGESKVKPGQSRPDKDSDINDPGTQIMPFVPNGEIIESDKFEEVVIIQRIQQKIAETSN